MIAPFSFMKTGGADSSIFVILWGQSGMVGHGTPFPTGYTGDIPRCKIWDGSGFITLNGSVLNNNQYTQKNGDFASEMSFLKQLSTLYDTVYCVKLAVGATSLATVAQGGSTENWNPATVGSLYDSLVSMVASASSLLPANCVDGGCYGFQGEEDSNSGPEANLYYTNLGVFVTNFRTDTGRPTLKFYFTRILNSVDGGIYIQSPRIRTALQTYAYDNSANGISMINIDDLATIGDGVHLDGASQIILGGRFDAARISPPSVSSLILSTDFSGTTIVNNLWQLGGASSATISQNNKIIFTSTHAGSIPFESGRSLLPRTIATNGNIYTRCKMSWTDPIVTNEVTTGFLMHLDTNNYIAIMTDTSIAGGNGIKIRKRVAGVNTETATAAVNGDEFKIAYNCQSGAYACYRWNGSAWASIGSDTSSFSGAVKPLFCANDSAVLTGGDLSIFEEYDQTIVDFSTRRP